MRNLKHGSGIHAIGSFPLFSSQLAYLHVHCIAVECQTPYFGVLVDDCRSPLKRVPFEGEHGRITVERGEGGRPGLEGLDVGSATVEAVGGRLENLRRSGLLYINCNTSTSGRALEWKERKGKERAVAQLRRCHHESHKPGNSGR